MPARYETIANWVNEYGWKRGAELGLFDGRTFFCLLDHCPDLELIGVDVWDLPGFSEGPTKSGERCFCPYCSETRASRKASTIKQMREAVCLSALGYDERAVICRTATDIVAREIVDHSLDFVFIDADHSTEGVRADIEAWLPKIKPGGRLIGHDWNMLSVRNAVFAASSLWHVNTEDDHLWWVQC